MLAFRSPRIPGVLEKIPGFDSLEGLETVAYAAILEKLYPVAP